MKRLRGRIDQRKQVKLLFTSTFLGALVPLGIIRVQVVRERMKPKRSETGSGDGVFDRGDDTVAARSMNRFYHGVGRLATLIQANHAS